MKFIWPLEILSILISLSASILAQSLGFYPTLNLGFNPYLSPLYGYGLGLTYGGGVPGISPFGAIGSQSLMSKIHSKALVKQLTLPEKIVSLKHPELTFPPYAVDYNFGRHYGAAMLPNNPYKSAYNDYYSTQFDDLATSPTSTIKHHKHIHQHNLPPSQLNYMEPAITNTGSMLIAKKHSIIKPLFKIGALLTAAALLAKKSYELPPRFLNPAGMILSSGPSSGAHQLNHLSNRIKL